jgi:uncharacterized protein (TIGR02246 family)
MGYLNGVRDLLGIAAVAVVLVACGGGSPAPESQAATPTPAGPTVEEDIAAIQALYAGWNKAVEASDVAGYVSVLDPEVELLPVGAPPIAGTAGYAEMLDGVFSTNTYEIVPQTPATIEVAGDWAWSRYNYVIHRTPKGSEETFSPQRKFLDILRRQPDGSWGVYRHIWNYNSPDATP